MVISCLTVYAIVFSCFTLLVGKSFAATPVRMDVPAKASDRKGNKIHFYNQGKVSSSIEIPPAPKAREKFSDEVKVLQSSYRPSNLTIPPKTLLNESIRTLNESHSYFAMFDPIKNVTQKVFVPDSNWPSAVSENIFSEYLKAKSMDVVGRKKTLWEKVQNFVAWDVLEDSEREVRIHYNDITAKETVVSTGIDEETGKK